MDNDWGEETHKIINRFYWSVYELNNGEVIVQQKLRIGKEKLQKHIFSIIMLIMS